MIARYDGRTLARMENSRIFKSISSLTSYNLEVNNALCMKCCSDKVYDRLGNEVHCSLCAPDEDGPTTIHCFKDFYNVRFFNELDLNYRYRNAFECLTWTDLIKYVRQQGLLGEKDNQYSEVLNISDTNVLAERYQKGDGIATARLAECYAQGIGVDKDAAMAYKLFYLAEGMGESYSAVVRAMFLRQLDKQHYAFIVLGQASSAGNPVAMHHFADDIFYRKKPNYKEISYQWWKKSADLGFIPSIVKCGELAPTFEEKIHYNTMAMNKGDSGARTRLFDVYSQKVKDPKDPLGVEYLLLNYYTEYLRAFEDGLLLTRKHTFTGPEHLMGKYEEWLVRNSKRITKALLEERKETFEFTSPEEQDEVFSWLEKDLGSKRVASENGRLTINLDYNEEISYEEDNDVDYDSLSFGQMLDRAKSGDSWAQVLVGDAYQYGQEAPINEREAIRWYLTAINNGQDEAYDELANIYYERKNRENNAKEKRRYDDCFYALSYLGAKAGGSRSCYDVGCYFLRRAQIERKALFEQLELAYVLRAAIQLEYPSINTLGCCFRDKVGVELRDYDLAVSCFKVAAESGNVFGMFNLAECYERGNGTQRDYTLAGKWYLEANKNGDKLAGERYDKLYRENKLNGKSIETAAKSDVEKGDVQDFLKRVKEHLDNKYYEDAATNIRHIEETILAYYVQVFIPECVYDNKGEQRKKLEEKQAIPRHYIEILYNIAKIGNSGAHANGTNGTSVNAADIKKAMPALEDLIQFYEAY